MSSHKLFGNFGTRKTRSAQFRDNRTCLILKAESKPPIHNHTGEDKYHLVVVSGVKYITIKK